MEIRHRNTFLKVDRHVLQAPLHNLRKIKESEN